MLKQIYTSSLQRTVVDITRVVLSDVWSLQTAVITYKFRLESSSGSVFYRQCALMHGDRGRGANLPREGGETAPPPAPKLTIAIFENDFVVLEEQL